MVLYGREGYFGGQVRISGGGNRGEGLEGFHRVGCSSLQQDLQNYGGVVDGRHPRGISRGQ